MCCAQISVCFSSQLIACQESYLPQRPFEDVLNSRVGHLSAASQFNHGTWDVWERGERDSAFPEPLFSSIGSQFCGAGCRLYYRDTVCSVSSIFSKYRGMIFENSECL